MIKVGIIGGSGYSAGELTRILLHHPDALLQWVSSRSCAGMRLDQVHQGLAGEREIKFTADAPLEGLDVLFCCAPYGRSREFLEKAEIPENLRIIDLARDFRADSLAYHACHDQAPAGETLGEKFIYGQGEINRKALVRGGKYVAGPGCLAQVVNLMLLPLARNMLLNSPIQISAVTGATCSGSERRPTSHYAWRNDNVVVYRPFTHPQLQEIAALLRQAQPSFRSEVNLVPMRGPFSRGILATAHMDCPLPLQELEKLYEDYYSDHSFTFLLDRQPDLKDVVGTNKCLLHLERIGGKLLVTGVIDNLLKGGAGTAVHNMNLLFGLQERTGLEMKALAF